MSNTTLYVKEKEYKFLEIRIKHPNVVFSNIINNLNVLFLKVLQDHDRPFICGQPERTA